MAKHAESESVGSAITHTILLIIIAAVVITAVFGSWEKFVLKMIDVIPWGNFFFKTFSKLLGTGISHMQGSNINPGIGKFLTDCMKLLMAATIMPIAQYFCGVKGGKHHGESTIMGKINEFFTDKIVIPVVVSLISAWLVKYFSNSISSIGGVWSWILSIVGSIAALGLSIWAFLTLSSLGLGWVLGYLCYKVIPNAVNAMLSYFVVLFILILISSPELMTVLGPVIIMLIGIMFLISSVFGSKGEAKAKLKETSQGHDFTWL